MLKKEFDYYVGHQDGLVKKYDGKFIAISNQEVLGAYESYEQAYAETIKTHEKGTFLIQECSPGEKSYTQIYHSRVAT